MKNLKKFVILLLGLMAPLAHADKQITVGSKNFTESYLLAEVISQIIESIPGYRVDRKFGLSDIAILARALKKSEIDIYPEYTGTLTHAFLKDSKINTISEINKKLSTRGLMISDPLGFNNTYVMTVRRKFAQKHGLKKISDLKKVPNLIVRVNPGFLERQDGFSGLIRHYQLTLNNVGAMEHGLLHQALADGQVDLIESYSTTGNLEKIDAVILQDDLKYFPEYLTVLMFRKNFKTEHPELWSKLSMLEGRINEKQMQALNARVDLNHETFEKVAREFLFKENLISENISPAVGNQKGITFRTIEHLQMVAISLFLACLIGIPLGIIAVRNKKTGQILLMISGLFQTIPSLALLCFFIPVFGIGKLPAVIALLIYGLLPIIRNTYTGIMGIDPRLIEVESVLGMSEFQKIFWIELPLASPSILAGIKTSAVINIGTATLAALIGAGGLGVPIVTGLSLNNMSMVFSGALPAAGLSIVAHFLFEGFDRVLIPRGLQKMTLRAH